jgi:hypothetical protein
MGHVVACKCLELSFAIVPDPECYPRYLFIPRWELVWETNEVHTIYYIAKSNSTLSSNDRLGKRL